MPKKSEFAKKRSPMKPIGVQKIQDMQKNGHQ